MGVRDGSAAQGEFAFSLYRTVAQEEDGNICLSPYSIESVFAMLSAGARGSTRDELFSLFGFSESSQFHRAFSDEMDLLRGADGATVYLANALWPAKKYVLRQDFMELLETRYGAEVERLDFGTEPEKSADQINKWVERHTEGMISQIVQADQFSDLTRLILTNAVYFNASWNTPFPADKTAEDIFYTRRGDSISVDYMQQEASFSYGTTEHSELLLLPYSGGEFSLLLARPHRKEHMEDLEERLSPALLNTWDKALSEERLFVSLPKWKMKKEYEVSSFLHSLGLASAFTPQADFGGVSESKEDLFIDRVLHKTAMEVSEAGTEAAAATAITMRTTSVNISEPREVRFDSPFLFFIRHDPTGRILFMGRMDDPS
ncbi:serpin family protein [Chitinivibrio alkaliphilus]|uniref:Serine protease inhibitor n=1 Tax=Chitinivibrio alkaliphilus ACht1 TaxID=1313304 RepID=U7D4J6_9BACT|nr:serpin family protein [Chitinivibrio alkaliphilus]ERP30853.1 serine protease inhibitor [Chitinivibrio alkaliphilus ACht1]